MSRRPSKEEYYLNIAQVVSNRSTCLKVSIGAIIVKDDQIIASGYVGAPRKTKSSIEHNFCLRQRLNIPSGQQYELCRSVHAEQNAIINAARAGVSLLGGDMFIFGSQKPTNEVINAFPCFICKKMIINAGINKIITSAKDPAPKFYTFYAEEWIKEWQKNDIIMDEHQYGK